MEELKMSVKFMIIVVYMSLFAVGCGSKTVYEGFSDNNQSDSNILSNQSPDSTDTNSGEGDSVGEVPENSEEQDQTNGDNPDPVIVVIEAETETGETGDSTSGSNNGDNTDANDNSDAGDDSGSNNDGSNDNNSDGSDNTNTDGGDNTNTDGGDNNGNGDNDNDQTILIGTPECTAAELTRSVLLTETVSRDLTQKELKYEIFAVDCVGKAVDPSKLIFGFSYVTNQTGAISYKISKPDSNEEVGCVQVVML